VEVHSADTGKTFTCVCNDWLQKKGSDESGLRKELLVGSADQAGPTNYTLVVHTRCVFVCVCVRTSSYVWASVCVGVHVCKPRPGPKPCLNKKILHVVH